MSDKPTISVEVNTHTAALKTRSSTLQTQSHSPFHIAVMGDFSGHSNNSENKPRQRFIELDRDNFDEVMASFNISLSLNIADKQNINIQFKELDDFHPDVIYENIESFSKLRSLRRRLKNNSSFDEAATEIQSWLPASSPAQPQSDTTSDTKTKAETPPDNLLDSILVSQQTQSNATSSTQATNIDKLIKSIVAPYVEAVADPRQDEMLAMVDMATQMHMRDILHHADFQALESSWQSLYFLIKRLQTDSKLKIFLLDISKQELQHDLSVDDLTTSSLYNVFCNPAEGDLPWSVLLGNFSFNDNIEDALTLAGIGAIAEQANAPFIAGANETLAGCESFSKTADYEDWDHAISDGTNKAWNMLKQSSVSSYIGLALPRFLLRLPYGKKSKPIDSFSFEEMTEENNHNNYLWGNAAFIKVECLARNFTNNGWNMQLTDVFQTDNLPIHYFLDDGETVSKAVAEIMLTEKGGEILRDNGLIPLWSVRNMDCIRSSDYHSIHENRQNLAGRWA
jgi:type VI secretion system protein ImpC